MVHALEIAKQTERQAVGASKFNGLAKPSTVRPWTTRPGPEFAAPKHHRDDRLGRLNRDGSNPARKSCDAKPILVGPSASPTAMKHHRAPARDVTWIKARGQLVHHRAAAINLRVPQRGCS